MTKRFSILVGAGAVLDLNFDNVSNAPTTDNITKDILSIAVQNVSGEDVNVIRQFYDGLLQSHYETDNPKRVAMDERLMEHYNKITFETLYDVIERFLSFNRVWNDEWITSSIFPPVAAFVSPKLQIDSKVLHGTLEAIEQRICSIIGEYDMSFYKNPQCNLWYRQFWKSLHNFDVFTLNYDTTIENSLGIYEDGFCDKVEGMKRFSPNKLFGNALRPTINHLHGCINYLNEYKPNEDNGYNHYDMYKFANFEMKNKVNSGYTGEFYTQSHESIVQRSILIGHHKPDKIIYCPMNFYYNNFVNKIIQNNAIIIIGYSFGDLYLNEIIEKMKVIHGNKRRIVIIDKIFGRQLSMNTKSFCSRMVKDFTKYHQKLKEEKYFQPIVSEDGTMMFCECGFKYSVENNYNTIIDYINS